MGACLSDEGQNLGEEQRTWSGNSTLEELWAIRRISPGGQTDLGTAGSRYHTYSHVWPGASWGSERNVVPTIAPHTHEDQTFGVVGRWAHEDQTLPSGQLGSVNLIFVGLSQRSSHLRSHSNHFIQNPLKSLLCFPGSGSFSYIYTFALLLVLLTEGNARRGRSCLTIEGCCCYLLWTSKIKKKGQLAAKSLASGELSAVYLFHSYFSL